MTTIRVMTTPAAVLRHAMELAERRDGEDRWEMQARTLDELGYRIVSRDDVVLRPTVEDSARLAAALSGIPLGLKATLPLAEQVRYALTNLVRQDRDELDPSGGES